MNAVPRIVVGVDGFESSKAALRWAIHQAKLTGAVVDAVTTWHIPPGPGWSRPPICPTMRMTPGLSSPRRSPRCARSIPTTGRVTD